MHGNGTEHHGGGMQMFFFLGGNVTLFFKDWITKNSIGKFLGACLGLIIVGVLYEGLKVGRIYLLRQRYHHVSSTVITNHESNGTKIEETVAESTFPRSNRMKLHWIQTFLHVLQVFVGYMLMLAFMTYNVWICLAVLIGSGIGYFVFGWIFPIQQMGGDHCN